MNFLKIIPRFRIFQNFAKFRRFTICLFEVCFRQLWLVGCAGCTVFGCFWQTNLCKNFGQQFLSGAKVCSKSLLPPFGQTQTEHNISSKKQHCFLGIIYRAQPRQTNTITYNYGWRQIWTQKQEDIFAQFFIKFPQ